MNTKKPNAPKNLNKFLKEAVSKTNSREEYWNDPDLFSGSEELIDLIRSGKMKLDSDNIASAKKVD